MVGGGGVGAATAEDGLGITPIIKSADRSSWVCLSIHQGKKKDVDVTWGCVGSVVFHRGHTLAGALRWTSIGMIVFPSMVWEDIFLRPLKSIDCSNPKNDSCMIY